MRCPFCHSEDTQVLDTRASEEGDSIRRRRRCNACDKRFTTYERVELAMPVIVKKNGSRTEFESVLKEPQSFVLPLTPTTPYINKKSELSFDDSDSVFELLL